MSSKRAGSPKKAVIAKAARVSLGDDAARVDEQFAPVCAALAVCVAEQTLGAACAEMLRAAAPHALEVPKEERHTYQVSVVTCIGEAITDAEAARRARVQAVEAAIAELVAKKENITADIATAKSEAVKRKEVKDAKGVADDEATKAVEATTQGVVVAKQRQDAHAAEVQTIQDQKNEFEGAKAEVWEKLKAGEFAGKAYRQRDKAITQVVQLLQKLGVPNSLAVALETTLKLKVKERGHFGAKTLEFCEAAWDGHTTALAATIDGCAGAASECAAAVAAALDALKEEQAKKKEATDQEIDADNSWCEQETRVYEIGQDLQALEGPSDERHAELAEAKEALADLREMQRTFNVLRDQSNAPPQATHTIFPSPSPSPSPEGWPSPEAEAETGAPRAAAADEC